MKFLCGSCRTKYAISDEKVRGKILTIRCKKCGAKILVKESLTQQSPGGGTAVAPVAEEEQTPQAAHTQPSQEARSASNPASARVGGSAALASAYDIAMHGNASGADADDMPTSIAPVPANLDLAGFEWYVAVDGEQRGPFAFAELVNKVKSAAYQGRHYVWHDGMDDWKRIRDVSDLALYIPAPKKVPPPPPTPEAEGPDADVVDIATKRAERATLEQAPVEEAFEPSDDLDEAEKTAVESAQQAESRSEELAEAFAGAAAELEAAVQEEESPEAAQVEEPVEPEADAEEEEPLSAAQFSQVQGGGSLANEAILEFAPSAGGEEEDIFANVPRATEAELVERESTRFFVAAAGVNNTKSKNRVGLFVGLASAAALIAFLGLWASGVLKIELPGIGNPFAGQGGSETTAEVFDGAADDGDYNSLLGSKKKNAKGAKKGRKRRRIARKSKSTDGFNIPQGGGFIADKAGGFDELGTRGGGAGTSIAFEGAKKGTGGARAALPEVALPSSGQADLPPVDAPRLSEGALEKVIAARKPSVKICYQQSIKAREDLRGKLEILVVVEKTGKVSKAVVQTSTFKGSKLGRCIVNKIRGWAFPRFSGEPVEVLVPFVLEKASYN